MNRRKVFTVLILASLMLCCGYGSIFDIAFSASNPFLDQKKVVPPRMEWSREIVSKNGGSFTFRVSSQGPIGVTLITARGYKASIERNDKAFKKEDVILTVDSKNGQYKGYVTVPAGSSWFIIENQTDKEVEIHLQCFE